MRVDLMQILMSPDRDAALAPLCEGPVVKQGTYFDGTPLHLITGYDEIKTVLTDPRFSNDPNKQTKVNLGASAGLPEEVRPYFLSALGAQDPPDHTRLRRLVSKEFTFRRVERLKPRIQEIVDELLRDMAGKDEADLVQTLAYPLPIRVICELLGVPLDDQGRWRQWSEGLGTPDLEVVAASSRGLVEYILDLVRRKRESPGDDLLSALIANDELTLEELTSLALSILVAGHETTVTVISASVWLLLTHPDQLDYVRADLTRIPGAVEEIIRFNGPADVGPLRYTLEDVEIGGVTIPADEPIMPVYFAGNRDPRVHTAPMEFRVDRPENAHLGFGHGMHFCLGAALARAEVQVVLPALLTRFPDLALVDAGAKAPWQPGPARSMASLPVRLR